jgi:drug/metabolite transporter (DMT)-like permease
MSVPRLGRGIVLMVGATLAWSTGGLIVRSLSATGAWEVVFWRSVFMSLLVAGWLVVRYGRSAPLRLRAIGRGGIAAGAMLAGTFFFFILSLTHTTVANTLVIMSISPFTAALAGWLALGERVAPRTWAAMAAALAGIALMFWDSLAGASGASLIGNLLALGVPACMALNIVLVRRAGAIDMVPTVLVAGLISIAVAAPVVWPPAAPAGDMALIALMGVAQLGIGCMLATMAMRLLSAAQVGLLSLLETVLGPLWVWLGFGEAPSAAALVGGAIVVAALAANELWALARHRPPPASASGPAPAGRIEPAGSPR